MRGNAHFEKLRRGARDDSTPEECFPRLGLQVGDALGLSPGAWRDRRWVRDRTQRLPSEQDFEHVDLAGTVPGYRESTVRGDRAA